MQEILGRGTFVKDDGEWTAKAADQMQPWVSGERRKHCGLRGRGFRKQCGSKGTLARVEQLLSHGQLEGSRSAGVGGSSPGEEMRGLPSAFSLRQEVCAVRFHGCCTSEPLSFVTFSSCLTELLFKPLITNDHH